MKLDEMCRTLVDDLLAAFDEITGEWTPSWTRGTGLPKNASTSIHYQGINTLMLMFAAIDKGYPTAIWATYKQWAALGAQVRKGEKGIHCIKWVALEPKHQPKDQPVKAKIVPTSFVVFNAAQVDGWETETPQPIEVGAEVERFLEATGTLGVTVVAGEPAYSPTLDVVMMPDRTAFQSPEAYAATFAHELAHWTGHQSRLDRAKFERWGDAAYAAEELVAEISAALTCAWYGLPNEQRRDSHAKYVKAWLSKLDDDPSLLYKAAQQAQQASNWIITNSTAPTLQPVAG